MANSGEQCRNWAMRETLDGTPLCDVHGGVSGWQKGECPVEWPLPEAVRCKEKRVDGGRCQARAVVDGLCVNHAGLTGFELNNEVAWKSGLYARPTIEEKNARIAFKFGWSTVKLSRELDNGDLGLELWQMIILNRFLVRDLLENLSDSEINRSWGVFVRHVRLIFRGAELIGKLLVEAKSANGDREEATRTFLNDVGKYALHSPEIDDSSDE
jgi:hypothetical protein